MNHRRSFLRARTVLGLLVTALVASAARADEIIPQGGRLFRADHGTYGIDGTAERWPNTTAYLAKADPGQLVRIDAYVTGSTTAGTSPFLNTPVRGRATVVSVTGATLEAGQNVYYPDGSTPEFFDVLPYTFEAVPPRPQVGFVHGAYVIVRIGNLDKKGHGVPVRIKFRIEAGYGTNVFDPTTEKFAIDDTFTVVLPVTDAPPLTMTAKLFSNHPGELRAGGSGTLQYTVEAPGSTMEPLSFRVRIPKGTTVFPGTVSPVDGVVQGSYVTWTVPGPVTKFNASVGINVKARPGTKNTTTVYQARAKVRGFSKTATDRLAIPVKSLDLGQIDYYGDAGAESSVQVGHDYPFICSAWDADGGDIFVSLNDVGVTTVPLAAPFGTFRVPPFRDPDLEHVLSARQTGKPTDTVVTGAIGGDVELALGKVSVTGDDGTFYRTLKTGAPVALGEIDQGTADLGTSNRFGLVQIDGATSAALIRLTNYPADTRLLYARGGGVAVFGAIRVGRLRLGTGKGTKSISFQGTADFSAYDTASQPDVTLLSDAASGPADFTISGFARATNWKFGGSVKLSGAVLFIEGDADIGGDVTGEGAIICTGNLTHRGKFVLHTNNALALGVAGTFTTIP